MAAALPVIVNEFGEVGIDHHLRHERFVFHFMPTSCSWLNAVKGFFARLSTRRLKRARRGSQLPWLTLRKCLHAKDME
jgi:hypothetical protein